MLDACTHLFTYAHLLHVCAATHKAQEMERGIRRKKSFRIERVLRKERNMRRNIHHNGTILRLQIQSPGA